MEETEISRIAPSTGGKRQHIRLSKAIRFLVRIVHGSLLGLLADFVFERPLCRQSRDGRAHFDTYTKER